MGTVGKCTLDNTGTNVSYYFALATFSRPVDMMPPATAHYGPPPPGWFPGGGGGFGQWDTGEGFGQWEDGGPGWQPTPQELAQPQGLGEEESRLFYHYTSWKNCRMILKDTFIRKSPHTRTWSVLTQQIPWQVT